MNQYETERRLCLCYAFLVALLTITSVGSAIPYNHWRTTLEVCQGTWLDNNFCGCIFFGFTSSQNFNGGHNSYCMYAILAPLPILVYALVMALFHMYRVCINNVGQYEDEKSTTIEELEGEAIVVSTRARVTHRNDGVIYCWIPTSCLAAVFCVYNLAHAGFITHGFFKTCTQYRSYLVREFHAAGDHAAAIHFRLACQAIFDFMDYVQKDAPNSRRGDAINTGAALQIAIIASWLSVFIWIVVTVLTAIRAHKERGVLTCCGK